jgi:hypothetical protein
LVNVPSQYQSIVAEAASGTGIPQSVVAAQIQEESGFNPSAVSPAGAEGMFQFLPSTYASVAAQAGVPSDSEFNPVDEVKAYIVYMRQLLSQEGGSIFKALEAYNAGPNNLSAGAGYANTILSNAGTPVSITASGGSGTTATAVTVSDPFPFGNFDPLNWPFAIGNAASNAILGQVAGSAKKIRADLWGWAKPLLIRFGLIILGVVILYAGITGSLKGGTVQPQATLEPAMSEKNGEIES